MNSISLRNAINKDRYMKNAGIMILSCDELLSIEMNYPFLCIVNTDERYLSGTHWLCIYVDEYKHCNFWDSLGFSPNHYKKYFMEFIDKYCYGYSYVNTALQLQTTQA